MEWKVSAGLDYVIRDRDSAFIPKDEGNRDYREYLDFVESGGEVEEIDVTPIITDETFKQSEYTSGENRLAPGGTAAAFMTALEVVVLELDARGEPISFAFGELRNKVKAVSEKVKAPRPARPAEGGDRP